MSNLLAKSIDASSKIFSHMTRINSINTRLLQSFAESEEKYYKTDQLYILTVKHILNVLLVLSW